MNDARALLNVRPLERKHFHLARAASKGKIARIAKVGAQVLAHSRPIARLDEARAHAQVSNLRDVGNSSYQAGLARHPVCAPRNRQLQMHRVASHFLRSLVQVLEPAGAVDLLRAASFEPFEQWLGSALQPRDAPKPAYPRIA
ncbi:MAG: hypothetical protein WA005_01485 [Candidatus Binataceae bacterium]